MASSPHRASLEPLTPALVGIGLLHVLGAMVLWIVLPMLPSKENSMAKLPANLVWRTPSDFTGDAMPLDPPVVATNEKKNVKPAPAAATKPPAPIPVPARPSLPASPASVNPVTIGDQAKSDRIQFTPAKQDDPAVSLAPSGLSLVPPNASRSFRQMPPDTLAMLENSIGSSSGIDGVKAGIAAQILGSPPSTIPQAKAPAPPVKPEMPAPPPVQPGPGREANKYITLSAIVDEPSMPAKPLLSLLDIAKLNDMERARRASVDASGLDAVDGALQKTLMSAWIPPAIELVPANQRRVSVELAVLKDGTVKDAVLVTPSGSGPLDASVRAALARVVKIPESLPASYNKERYAVRVNLQIE